MFPTINHIDDVLPYVAHKDEFKVMDKGDYKVIDYVISKEDTFDSPEAIECRGIRFFPNGEIMARPPQKFFNVGERQDLEERHWKGDFRIFEKLDGSLIVPVDINDEIRLGTKAGITDVSIQCEKELNLHEDFYLEIGFMLRLGLTPIFEYTSPTNRIVIKYEGAQLTLIAVRDTVTGEYQPLDDYAEALGVPRVQEYKNVSIADVKEWNDREGVVLVWDSGYRVKCKADEYVLKHKTKDSISQEKNVLALVLDDSVDDLAGILDKDDFERVNQYKNVVWESIRHWSETLWKEAGSMQHLPRKEVAQYVTGNMEKPQQSVFWQIYSGKNAEESVVNIIRKNLTTQTRVDSVRSLIGTEWNK